MNRAEKMVALAAAKALVKALDDDLKDAARREWIDEEVAVEWRRPGVGSLIASFTHDSTTVTDEAMFMEWFAARYPDEVKYETVTQVRNPAWRDQMLANLEAVDPDELQPGQSTQCRLDDEIVPGVMRTKGGAYNTAAFTQSGDLKRTMADAAALFVEAGTPMPALMSAASSRVIEGSATLTDRV